MQTAQDFHTLANIIQLVGPILADQSIKPSVKEPAEKLATKCFELMYSSLTESSARQSGIIM